MSKAQRRLLPMAQERARSLLAETGHVLVLDDYEHLSTLNELSLRVLEPEDPDELSLLNLPIGCGRHLLRQPTLAKLEWLKTCAQNWWDTETVAIATGYVCTLPDNEQALALLYAPNVAEKAVYKFWRSLHVPSEDFYAALERVLPYNGGVETELEVDGDDEGEEGGNICGPTASLLSREYGGSPAYWLFEAPIGLSQSMTADYIERMQREAEQARKRQASTGHHRGGTRRADPPAPTPKMYAQKRLRNYCNALRERWQTIKPNSSLSLTTG